jgi:hypothetical protein
VVDDPIKEYPELHDVATVADVQAEAAVPQAVQTPLDKKYPVKH